MADRRMFSKTIIDSDQFLDMPLSTQALYFHLSMRADDDGFVNNPRKIQRMIGASDDDLKLLITKNFVLPFNSGIVVIKHWRIHNYLRNDRYKETVYQAEKAMLQVSDNGAYELTGDVGIPSGNQLATNGIPTGNHLATQDRIGKDSIGEDRKDKDKTKSALTALEEMDLSDDLKEALRNFIDMRKGIKKPMSERALQLIVKKLKDMTSDESTQIAIVNQSVMYNWLSFYPLKEEARYGKTGVKLADTTDHELDEVFSLGSSWSE